MNAARRYRARIFRLASSATVETNKKATAARRNRPIRRLVQPHSVAAARRSSMGLDEDAEHELPVREWP
jgi:hypothetical protein